jgi:hypothetical protein
MNFARLHIVVTGDYAAYVFEKRSDAIAKLDELHQASVSAALFSNPMPAKKKSFPVTAPAATEVASQEMDVDVSDPTTKIEQLAAQTGPITVAGLVSEQMRAESASASKGAKQTSSRKRSGASSPNDQL